MGEHRRTKSVIQKEHTHERGSNHRFTFLSCVSWDVITSNSHYLMWNLRDYYVAL